jgi:D-serine dehydratase
VDLDRLLTTPLDPALKGLPGLPAAAGLTLNDIAKARWSLLRGELPFPVATIDGTALAANSRWMRDFTRAHGLFLCPHGKTTMAPQLFRRQLEDGAWGITVATVQQLRVCRIFGVKRLLMANQLLAPADLREVFEAIRADAALDFYCLVDSAENADQLSDAARRFDAGRPLQVLLEAGVPGGRTGCRSREGAFELAAMIDARRPYLALRGIEGFEGVMEAGDEGAVRDYVAGVCALAGDCRRRGLFGGGRPILSLGGSIFFDIVATHPGVRAAREHFDVILRSGCYLTHDSRMLAGNFERMRARSPGIDAAGGPRPALTVWGLIQSLPEPGLAILDVGKRDVSYDVDLPVAERWYRQGLHTMPVGLPEPAKATQINDQHLFLAVSSPTQYRVGDVIGLGISHPCTTFDKWRLLYVLDDQFEATEGILTFF